MEKDVEKKKIINIISNCQKEFDKNLKNKSLMFICEDKNRIIDEQEMFFPLSCFYHLTGIKAYENNKELNSYRFYDLLKKGTINANNLIKKDTTTDLKLQVLPQLMKIDKNANMIGNFYDSNIYLQTEKVAGNINSCMGFVKNNETNLYIPNTALKRDIRDITKDRKKVIAILKKDFNEKLYKNITYLKKGYNIDEILNNEEIRQKVDNSISDKK